MKLNDLQTLRVSMARIAQSLDVDNALSITGNGYADLCAKARSNERGWNDLASRCVDRAGGLLERIEDLTHKVRVNNRREEAI